MSCSTVYIYECPVLNVTYQVLAVIAGGNLCHGNNINNDVLANDELIFIGHTSSCASLHECVIQ